MEVKHLAYFAEVTRTGSFTRAAENLYITQPALSRIVKSLEEELGVVLFIRSRKKLILTKAGKIVYDHAVKFQAQFAELKSELNEYVTQREGHIRIGLPTIADVGFFSELISSFHQDHPEVVFQLEEDGSKAIEEKVMEAKLDFGVAVLPEEHALIDYFAIVEEYLCLVVPATHPMASRESVKLTELENEKFIMFTQDFALRNILVAALKDAGMKPRIVSETSQLDFIEEMIAADLGITLLPESVAAQLTDEVVSIDIEQPRVAWNLAFIWKKDAHLSQIARAFIQFTHEKLLERKIV
ncbi:LysR family transcriptional regulator [Virgibacillus halophilus]|uniref:LysR family transcriptional regulator n=1 Tax=Tigheibacillus halophilus TaxID=361280 RepID=A0ABU5C4X8_9BACI|nr:LysR family transcriptional regulator [Virgibacillus halophilus]